MALAPVLVALALAAPAAAAEPSPAVREQVRDLLGAIHGGVSPETFRALGPGAVEALVEFAREGPPMRRIRALEALSGLGGDGAEAVHREVAASSAPPAVRRGAVRGLARLGGPERATRELAPYLEQDRDPTVRAAAAEALARAAPAEACPRIRAQARAERSGARFGRAVALCGRAQRAPAGSR